MPVELTIVYEEGDRGYYHPYVQLRKYHWFGHADYILEYGAGLRHEWRGEPNPHLHETDPGIHFKMIPIGHSDSECIREAVAKYDELVKEYGR